MCPRRAGEDAHWHSSGTASEQAGLHTAGALAVEEPGRRIVFWGLFEGFNATMTSETNPSCPSAAALKVEMLMWNDWQAASGILLWHFCESSRRSGSPWLLLRVVQHSGPGFRPHASKPGVHFSGLHSGRLGLRSPATPSCSRCFCCRTLQTGEECLN